MDSLKIYTRAASLYEQANRKSRGVLEIVRQAFLRFGRVQGLEAAAAIAYFTIFSIFPLLLVLISVAGFMMKGQEAVDVVMEFISQVLPAAPSGIETVLRQVVVRRDISGIIGILGLLFSASGVFTTLARNINRAWPNARSRNLVLAQLSAIGLIFSLVVIMILWLIWTWFINLLIAQDFPTLERLLPFHEYFLTPLARLFPWLASFLLFLLIYRWLPNTKVRWLEALWGAIVASIAWGLLTAGFSWYLSSGGATYDLLYGSLGTSIALLTWIYISALIILIGAHLSAAIARATRPSAHALEAKPPSTD
jgi:membrane protein